MSSSRPVQPALLTRACFAAVVALLAAVAIAPTEASATALPTTINENMTLTAEGSPYTGTSTTISEGVTVTAEPGAVIKLTGTLTSKGTLDVNGTAEESVVFTSSTNTAAGQWTGIVLQAGAGGSNLAYAEVRYAKTAIAISGGISPVIANSLIRDNSIAGLSASAGNTEITANTVVNNPSGILTSGSGNPEIAENMIEDCSGIGISRTIGTNQSGEVRIHDNVVERCGNSSNASIYVFSSSSPLTGVTLAGNTITDGNGRAIDYYTPSGGGAVPPDIDENTITGNASNAVWIAGRLTESTTWEDHGFVIVPRGGYDLSVVKGATLTLGPGVVLKPSQINAQIAVAGEVIAEGTSSEPITVTSIKDDSIGGDTNQDGSATQPAPGDYIGFSFSAGTSTQAPGRGTLDYVHARYGGRGSSCGSCGPMFSFGAPANEGPTSPPSSVTHSAFDHSVRPAISGGSLSQITDSTFSSNGTAISVSATADPQITGNTFSQNGDGIIVSGSGDAEIAENTIEDCSGYGIARTLGGSGALGTVSIHDNVIEECGSLSKASIYVNDEAFGPVLTGVTVAGNTITDGNGRAIDYYVNSSSTIAPDIDENTITGNASNAVWVAGKLTESTTWENRGFVIVPRGGYNLKVAAEATLTLGPGLVLKPYQTNAQIQIDGELIAEGTESEPITFTSLEDDSIGGDTNMDGSATQPGVGDWRGVSFTAGTSSKAPGWGTLDYVHFRYGASGVACGGCSDGKMVSFGAPNSSGPTSPSSSVQYSEFEHAQGTAMSGGPISQITDSTFASNGTAASITATANPQITGNTLSDNGNGILTSGSGNPEIAENTIEDCSGYGISRTLGGSGATGTVSIHDNVIEECGSLSKASIYVNDEAFGPVLTGVTVAGNTITDGNGRAIDYYVNAASTIPPDIDENTIAGNASNAVWVAGKLTESTTWENRGFVIVPRGGYDFSVVKGVTLTLGPGLVLKPYQANAQIGVVGELIAEGTETQPITITSIKDDSIGGDTNQDGSATQPAPGDFVGFSFSAGTSTQAPGRGTLDYVHARYGGYGGPCSCTTGPMFSFGSSSSTGPTSTRSTVNHSAFAFSTRPAISVGGDFPNQEPPDISWNRFAKNGTAIEKGGSTTLSAPYNDYGCLSGPRPAGCGDPVSAKVNPYPLQSEADKQGRCRGKKSDCPHGADPVSLATGELSYSHRDLFLTNKSRVPLEFVRSYSSGDGSDAGLGPAWSHSALATATELETGDVLVRRQDGRQDLFAKGEGGGYSQPAGVSDTLVKNEDGTFSLMMLDGMVYDFEQSGRIASISDDHGLKTTYGYDINGRLATITDPSAQVLIFSYDASNHITKVADSTGREVKYTYSVTGDLKTVTDAIGGVTEYTYDPQHRITSIKDPRGNVILQNTYDGHGRVIEQVDGLENFWTLEYKGGETVVTEPEGGEKAYGFDEQGRVVSETDQHGNTTTTGYDAAGNIDEIVLPGGAKWQLGYDTAGNLISATNPEEGQRSYEYDGQNRLTSFTDEREETWDYEWSEANDLIKITDPAEGETTATYNAAGQPLKITDPNEHTTTFTYDGRGNRLSAEDPLEHTTGFGFDARNYMISKTAPGLEPEEFGRNALGDLLSRTTPEGHTTEYDYDANGMLVELTDPAEGVWEIERNAMERPTAYIDPLEQRTEIAYDGNLNPVAQIDRRGKETSYGYDLANQLTGVERPEGGDWQFGYDARGNRTSVVDPRKNETTYDYDLLDRMTEVAEPLEAVSNYGYDPAGNLTSYTDPRENTTGLLYDELGRLSEINQPLEKTTSFTFDGVGNRLSRTTAAGTLEFEYDASNRLEEIAEGESTLRSFDYDAAGRMIGATDTQSDEIELGYDDDGNVIAIDDGRGQTVLREYDSRGNLAEQTDGRGTLEYGYDPLSQMTSLVDPQSKTLGFDYDPEGNLTEIERPNGVLTTNAYDDAGRLTETTSQKAEAILESFDYSYDPFGNRISKVDRLAEETTYSYDARNRLTEFDPPGEGSTSYAYDAAGNRVQAAVTTYGFNALNQLTGASDGTSYEYDGAGRLIEVAKGDQATTYGWNPFDELTSADDGSQEVTYTYDALGRRALRAGGSGARSAHYGDLTDVPIIDTDAEGAIATSYVQGPEGLAEQRSGEGIAFPLQDAHGDITALIDAEGEVSSRQEYDPWGAQLSGPELEMGYLGAEQRRSDPTTGLVQMGIRPYSTALGSFITEDPILGHLGHGMSFNRYAYVWNNPLLYFDLTGRSIFGNVADAAGDAWNATGGRAWDASAGARTAVGIAGDGNGGSLSETPGVVRGAPDYVSDRASDFVKVVNRAADCLARAVRHPMEDQDCLPDPPKDPLDPTDFEDPPDSPQFPPTGPPGVPHRTPASGQLG